MEVSRIIVIVTYASTLRWWRD